MSAAVAQVWCPRCQHEVIVALARDGRSSATCPWCDRQIKVPREATA